MTTLIDDGLVENCMDDFISDIDYDQIPVIDIDNIGATIEDPGYILDEYPNMSKGHKENTTSYKKGSFALPVAFFDISRNISLLKKCRPISVKIVDCDIYPWYYKEIKRKIKNGNGISNISVGDQNKSDSGITNLFQSTCNDTYVKDLVSLNSSLPKINLTSEQRSVVLKLKNRIGSQIYMNEINENIVDDVDNERVTINKQKGLSLSKENATESNFHTKCIESHDLSTYKAIAETIVRNIDHNDVNGITDNVSYIQTPTVIETIENGTSINVEKWDRNNTGETKQATEMVFTSPVLPYSTKPRKKAKRKEAGLGKTPKANNILEKCSDSNKDCDRVMSSVNQIIPHYHCRFCLPKNNHNNSYFTNVGTNLNQVQESIIKDPSLQSYQSGNKDLIPARISQGSIVTSSNSVGEMSYLGFNKGLYNNCLINNSQITNKQFSANVSSNFLTSLSDRQFNDQSSVSHQSNIHTLPGYSSQIKEKNGSSLSLDKRAKTKQYSKENFLVFSQPFTVGKNTYNNYVPNSIYIPNEYVDYNGMQSPLQKAVSNTTNIIQNNPLLNQLLNCNNLNEYYQPTMQQHGLVSRPVVGMIHHPSMGQNFSLPQRPCPPPPSYNFHLASNQFGQDKSFQYPNAGIHRQNLTNTVNTNSLPQQHKSYSNLEHIKINPFPPTQDRFNSTNILNNAPKVTNSAPPKSDSMKQNICAQTEIKNTDQIPPGAYEATDPNVLISMNSKIINQNSLNGYTKAAKVKDIKLSNKYNIEAMINVLSNKKSGCLYSKMHKCMKAADRTVPLLNKNAFNLLEERETPDSYQSNPISKIDRISKTDHIISQATENMNVVTSEQVKSKINGYSPPILPIPTFKKSIEMLSELQQPPVVYTAENNNLQKYTIRNTGDMSKQRKTNEELRNIVRKRKLNDDEKMYIKSRRISLEEYKLRRSENVITIT